MPFRIKPAQGLKVRDPKSLKPLTESGIVIQEMTTYWARRIETKDVVVENISEEEISKPNQAGGIDQ